MAEDMAEFTQFNWGTSISWTAVRPRHLPDRVLIEVAGIPVIAEI